MKSWCYTDTEPLNRFIDDGKKQVILVHDNLQLELLRDATSSVVLDIPAEKPQPDRPNFADRQEKHRPAENREALTVSVGQRQSVAKESQPIAQQPASAPVITVPISVLVCR